MYLREKREHRQQAVKSNLKLRKRGQLNIQWCLAVLIT